MYGNHDFFMAKRDIKTARRYGFVPPEHDADDYDEVIAVAKLANEFYEANKEASKGRRGAYASRHPLSVAIIRAQMRRERGRGSITDLMDEKSPSTRIPLQ